MTAWLETMGWMLVCAAVSAGTGALALSTLFPGTRLDPWRCFWCGLLATMPLAAAWHLVLPLDGVAALALAGLATWGWVRHGRAVLEAARRAARERPVSTATWAALWCALPWLALQPLTCIDSGLYYVAAVEWHRSFAQVPGLQATNPLSAMNSSAFHLLALAGTGPFAGQGHVVFNSVLAWWGLPVAVGAVEVLARRWALPALVVALTAAPAIDALPTDRMSCPSADIGVLWLGLALVALAIPPSRGPRASALAAALVAPMFKLSLAPLSLVLSAFLLLRDRDLLRGPALGKGLLLVAVAWLPALAGNTITSGYPLYPLAIASLEVSWALPHPLVVEVGQVIRSYAAHDGVAGEATALDRLGRLLLLNRAVLVPALLLLAGSALTGWRIARAPRAPRVLAGAVALAWSGWLFWFFSAPDPRFAGVLLWATSGLTLALGLGGVTESRPLTPPARALVVLSVCVLMLGEVPWMDWPGQVLRVRPDLPRVRAADWTTLDDGSRIIDGTPVAMVPPKCWAVPCAAVFPRGLRQRDPLDVRKGYQLPPEARLPPLSMK